MTGTYMKWGLKNGVYERTGCEFSWLCKGCNQELIGGEYVRLNGCVGVYDGHGCAGGFNSQDIYIPSAWHNYCYLHASIEQKLDETSSVEALRCGIGIPCLPYIEGYNPDEPVLYHVWIFHDEKELVLTDEGFEDDYKYMNHCHRIETDIITEKIESDEWKTMTEEEKSKCFGMLYSLAQAKIGRIRPLLRPRQFNPFSKALNAFNHYSHLLPSEYELVVMGSSGGKYGKVYWMDVQGGKKEELYRSNCF